MKLWQFSISLLLSVVCLSLAVSTLFYVHSARQLQGMIQDGQGSMNRIRQEQMLARSIIDDLIKLAPRDTRVMVFLQEHKISVPPPATEPFPAVQNPAPNATPAKAQKKTVRK